jgi:hypothetical protein
MVKIRQKTDGRLPASRALSRFLTIAATKNPAPTAMPA